MTGARLGRGARDGTAPGGGGGGGSPWRADPEERRSSGAKACSDPLRGICCKAHCRTAEGETGGGGGQS